MLDWDLLSPQYNPNSKPEEIDTINRQVKTRPRLPLRGGAPDRQLASTTAHNRRRGKDDDSREDRC